MTVMAYDANRRTNAQAIADAHELGYINDDDNVLDLTYERGRFWKLWRPVLLITNDLNPKMPTNWHLDFRDTGLYGGSYDVVVFDPPYGFRGTSKHAMDEGYGLGEYLSVDERMTMMRDGLKEAARLVKPKGHVLFKLQDQVVSGMKVWQSIEFAIYGEAIGLRLVDELHVVGYRAQPQRKCKACGGAGHLGPGTGADQRDYGRECVVCEGSGKVDMVQKHSGSNVSTLQIYRKER